jgi:ribosomal protein L40E
MFIPNPSVEHSRILYEALNCIDMAPGINTPAHTIADAARLMFTFEQDFFQDSKISGWHQRRYNDRSGYQILVSQGWGQPRIGHPEYYDNHFLPTLLDTDAYDFTKWSNYPLQSKPGILHPGAGLEYGKDKFFFVGITPYRDSTIIMANIPTMCTFGQRGELLTVNLQLGWMKWILIGIISLLRGEANVVTPGETEMKASHPYWSVINQFSEKAKVLPFEQALRDIENPLTESTGTTSQEACADFAGQKLQQQPNPTEIGIVICPKCNNRAAYNANFCAKCGAELTPKTSNSNQ